MNELAVVGLVVFHLFRYTYACIKLYECNCSKCWAVKCDDGGNGGVQKQNNCGAETPYTKPMQEKRVSSVVFAISAKTVVLLSACALTFNTNLCFFRYTFVQIANVQQQHWTGTSLIEIYRAKVRKDTRCFCFLSLSSFLSLSLARSFSFIQTINQFISFLCEMCVASLEFMRISDEIMKVSAQHKAKRRR